MRPKFLAALLIVVIGAGSYWYVATAHVCPVPLSYRVGQIDENFSISKEEAIERVAIAERVWEEAAGRDLFVYDESADFTINFVFDDRQATADSEEVQSARLDEKRQGNESLVETIEEMRSNYETLSNQYNERIASYESRLASYNQTVQKYNDRGGAPAGEFERLQQEKSTLDRESQNLQTQANELNQLADQLNDLANRSNQLVEEYNQEVQRFNRQFGYSREFTQGDYQGDRINIYKFSSDAELISVLTHEFGHALGIDHVEDDTSVMYYLLIDETENPTLSEADRAELIVVCGEEETLSQQLRHFIRSAIALIT